MESTEIHEGDRVRTPLGHEAMVVRVDPRLREVTVRRMGDGEFATFRQRWVQLIEKGSR